MRKLFIFIITAYAALFLGQAAAATTVFNDKTLDSLSSPLICAEDEKKNSEQKDNEKKYSEEDEEEPDCE